MEFTEDQKAYLSGFMAGVVHRAHVPLLQVNRDGKFTDVPENHQSVYGTPLEDLCQEELVKHELNGLDCYDRICSNAEAKIFPSGGDVFRYKFHGLFYVAPAQDSLMLRARMAGGSISSVQFRSMADIAEAWGNGYNDITTRANLQIREIMPENAPLVLNKLVDIGLTSQGSGADNVRNVTATPTTGFDVQELIDVMPYAKAMHHCIVKNRDLYGLPRKFNIAFDSGGLISVCADTNDIGFQAVRLAENVGDWPAGVYFRVQLCGITGHKQFASDCGLLLKPSETIPFAAALIRVFIEHGNRTDRKKARFKYLVDEYGVEKTLTLIQDRLAFRLRYYPLDGCQAMNHKVKHAHLGFHPQSDGNFYVGLVVPAARLSADQMRAIADIAEKWGRSDIRLTVWQNLLIPHIASHSIVDVKNALQAAGLRFDASSAAGGLVACTGNQGCKYAAANTKKHAVELGAYLDKHIALDMPINIHLTGCHHSCAQHYIGDIGMMGVKIKNAQGEMEEGYQIVLGGGVDQDQALAREVWKALPFRQIPALVLELLQSYQAKKNPDETFAGFTKRHTVEELRTFVSQP